MERIEFTTISQRCNNVSFFIDKSNQNIFACLIKAGIFLPDCGIIPQYQIYSLNYEIELITIPVLIYFADAPMGLYNNPLTTCVV